MDGFQTTQEILKKCNDLHTEKPYIIALTAHSESDTEMQNKCKMHGMNEMRNKPMNPDLIQRLFDQHGIAYPK